MSYIIDFFGINIFLLLFLSGLGVFFLFGFARILLQNTKYARNTKNKIDGNTSRILIIENKLNDFDEEIKALSDEQRRHKRYKTFKHQLISDLSATWVEKKFSLKDRKFIFKDDIIDYLDIKQKIIIKNIEKIMQNCVEVEGAGFCKFDFVFDNFRQFKAEYSEKLLPAQFVEQVTDGNMTIVKSFVTKLNKLVKSKNTFENKNIQFGVIVMDFFNTIMDYTIDNYRDYVMLIAHKVPPENMKIGEKKKTAIVPDELTELKEIIKTIDNPQHNHFKVAFLSRINRLIADKTIGSVNRNDYNTELNSLTVDVQRYFDKIKGT